MATGRIRRNARRGVAAAVLGWLVVAAAAIALAPSAGAAPAVTIEIRNLTPPAASVDPGGTVTFVNRIPAENKGGIDVGLAKVSATVFTDVTVDFFGQPRPLKTDESTAWTFSAPATPGWITYTYRVVPQATLPLGISAQQVIDRTLASLPPLPAPIPYVVQTVAPALPNLPSIGLPPLPQLSLPLPAVLPPGAPAPGVPIPGGPDAAPPPPAAQPQPGPGNQYVYPTGGALQLSPRNGAATAAFDPSRFFASGNDATGTAAGPRSGSGGLAGGYDGASVPVFGQLAGLNGTALDEESAQQDATAGSSSTGTLPAAALAAIVALAAVTAALVRTSQAASATR
jgi:hypothetical protein